MTAEQVLKKAKLMLADAPAYGGCVPAIMKLLEDIGYQFDEPLSPSADLKNQLVHRNVEVKYVSHSHMGGSRGLLTSRGAGEIVDFISYAGFKLVRAE